MSGIDGNHELFGGLQKRLMLKEKLCKMMQNGREAVVICSASGSSRSSHRTATALGVRVVLPGLGH